MIILILGYASMITLGLLPLAGLARLTGLEGGHVFFLPFEFALVVSFVTGITLCLAAGRALGLLEFRTLATYEQHRETFGESGSARRRRERRVAADTRRRSRPAR